jgi:bifunctional ADP-heptose synthase (sugar kinase/adenylyltransferase)
LAAGIKVGKRGSACISLRELELFIEDEHTSTVKNI